MKAKLDFALQAILGLVFLVFGLNGFLHFLPMPPHEGAQASFLGGLASVGYFFPLLKATELLVGLALLANRFVPLALVVLAPITINILAFQLLAPAGLPLPVLILVLHLGTAWHHRRAYTALLTPRFDAGEVAA